MANKVRDIRQMMVFRNKSRKATVIKDDAVYLDNNARYSSYTLDDFNWSQEFTSNPNNRISNRTIPKLILTEFQPERSLNFDELTKQIATTVAKWAKGKQGGDGWIAGPLNAGKRQLVQTGVTLYQSKLFNDFANPKLSQATNGVAMSFVKGLFTGQYLNVFEIPFFGDDYLIADTKDAWSESGSEVMMGDEASKTLQENFNINFPMSPIWKKGKTSKKVNWKNIFHLINDTNENLFRNFKFLNALTSGSFWIQMGMMQQSPNVYDIHCPGRFHQYFSALSVKVTRKGKERENVSVSNDLVKMGFKGFSNIENAILFPDAYEIEIDCADLSPNNFNTYMDHMIGHEKVSIGQIRDRFGGLKDIFNTVI